MPVKLGAKLPTEGAEARIEIIPLIDIMFFLLAAFMLVSLSLVSRKSLQITLPSATTATGDIERNSANISVDAAGLVFLNDRPIGQNELVLALLAGRKTNAHLRVFIRGDQRAQHGNVIQVLDLVRSCGIDKVAFEIRPTVPGSPP